MLDQRVELLDLAQLTVGSQVLPRWQVGIGRRSGRSRPEASHAFPSARATSSTETVSRSGYGPHQARMDADPICRYFNAQRSATRFSMNITYIIKHPPYNLVAIQIIPALNG